ncbi:LAGLIDADG family homing endonuclease [Streptomyces sp. NBC_01336]|uniref:LAGLIDADG family homing endonuclease n=1 Tax=Streptomyces sp. NBC_01336 TaxID=2903829 RepID=UPI002E12BE8A|nr:LAGLIDADG family homing endonuclease [Streptomyces sp. NBC_01336]
MAEHDPNAPTLFEVDALVAPSTGYMDLTDPRYAYMFGFVQADGHLSAGPGRKGRLTVEINVRDIAVLREFQQLTPYNSSITERIRSTNFSEHHHSAIWTVCSLEARALINELGVPYGPKSRRIAPPRVDFSARDYLRGVIDADGSVGVTGQGFPFVSLTTASTAVGAYLCSYAKQVTGAQRYIRRNARDGIYNVMYTMEAAVRLAEHLYYPGSLALRRKQGAAETVFAWQRPPGVKPRGKNRRWKVWEDETLLRLDRADSAAPELDRSVASCSVRLWRLKSGQVPVPADSPPGQ